MKAIITGLAAAALGVITTTSAIAQDNYPNKPITMVVSFAAGGSSDIIARTVAPKMAAILGQPVVVENRPGADGNVAAELTSQAAADGYTLLFTTNSFAINVSLYKGQSYDPIKDFTPIALLADGPNVVVVHPSVQAKTLDELVALSKTQPLNFGSTASGTYLATELLKKSTGLKAERVPYRGAGVAIPALLGGEIQLMLTGIINALPHIEGGTLKPIVVTGEQRSPMLPNVPTVGEAGLRGYNDAVWYGLLAPDGTPQAVIEKLNSAANEALKDPEVKQRLEQLTMVIKGGTSGQFADLIKKDVERWGGLIKETGATIN